MAELTALEKAICYTFRDRGWLEQALSHSSFVNEQAATDIRSNERLEFLGDAVLNLAAGHLLLVKYPAVKEGDLSRLRAHLVNEIQVARLARAIDLGRYLRLGKGEALSGGREKRSILADAYEALIGAVYLDGGFESAFRLVEAHLEPVLIAGDGETIGHDYKSRLQETAQALVGMTPDYLLLDESGPDHDKTFWVEVRVGKVCEQGRGKSKKMAEQDAARKALEHFGSWREAQTAQ
jgi:ribonuclease-3